MLSLLAMTPIRTWGLVDVAIAIIVIVAVIGIVFYATQYMGVTIPPVVMKIIGIVLVAVLAILAIKVVADAW